MKVAECGKTLFVAGLYCAGKTTLIGEALRQIPELSYIPTYTTREPRPLEMRDGSHEYIFVNQAKYDILKQTPGWDHTELRGISYGSDAAKVNREVATGQSYIVVTTMDPVQIYEMQKRYAGHTMIVFLDTSFIICQQRIMSPASGRSKKYLTDPTQSEEQANVVRKIADCVYHPTGVLAEDKVLFSAFVRRLLSDDPYDLSQ
jgi:guanylate kinase